MHQMGIKSLIPHYLSVVIGIGAERALKPVREGKDMVLSLHLATRKIWQTLSSIKTGVVLIILVVIFSAAGTVILQRPITDSDDM